MSHRQKGTVLLIISFVALSGIIVNMSIQDNIKEAFSLFDYYTLQSNGIVVVCCLIKSYYTYKKKRSKIVDFLFASSVLWIAVTGIVFHLLLSSLYHPTGLAKYPNIILHYVVPSSCLLYYIIGESDESRKWWWPLLFTSYPTVYALVSLIRGHITGFYPYWFLNPTGQYPEGIGSYSTLFLVFILMFFGFVLFGYLLSFVKILVLKVIYSNGKGDNFSKSYVED